MHPFVAVFALVGLASPAAIVLLVARARGKLAADERPSLAKRVGPCR
jgi:hypothetical protein